MPKMVTWRKPGWAGGSAARRAAFKAEEPPGRPGSRTERWPVLESGPPEHRWPSRAVAAGRSFHAFHGVEHDEGHLVGAGVGVGALAVEGDEFLGGDEAGLDDDGLASGVEHQEEGLAFVELVLDLNGRELATVRRPSRPRGEAATFSGPLFTGAGRRSRRRAGRRRPERPRRRPRWRPSAGGQEKD